MLPTLPLRIVLTGVLPIPPILGERNIQASRIGCLTVRAAAARRAPSLKPGIGPTLAGGVAVGAVLRGIRNAARPWIRLRVPPGAVGPWRTGGVLLDGRAKRFVGGLSCGVKRVYRLMKSRIYGLTQSRVNRLM
jgi:hypothetical protein